MPKKRSRDGKNPTSKPPRKKPAATTPKARAKAAPKTAAKIAVTPADTLAAGTPATLDLPAKTLPPGTAGAEIPVPTQSFQQMLTAAATQDNPGKQVWVIGGNELLVSTGDVHATLDDGLVLITIPVSCDQATANIQVPFAMGGKDSPAGMICATEDRPRGPAAIVDIWGESLIAFAWRLFTAVSAGIAAQGGADQRGATLIPAAITATKDGVTLLPMARHVFDHVFDRAATGPGGTKVIP